jgi:hypothetical protein
MSSAGSVVFATKRKMVASSGDAGRTESLDFAYAAGRRLTLKLR